MIPIVEFGEHAPLVAPSADLVRLISSVGPFGEAVTAWVDKDDLDRSPYMHPSRRVLLVDHQRPVVVTVQRSGASETTVVAELGIALTDVQSLPGGRILLVADTCLWTEEGGAARHVVVVDANGAVVHRGVIGAGVSHVLTTPTGRIWVGYTDMGIYGSWGWGLDGGPTPIGSSGLNQFTDDLALAWRFAHDEQPSIEPIDHCYALNVDGEDAWACTYDSFNIVHVHDGVVRSWTNEVNGPTALAVSQDRVALFGGYPGDSDRLVTAGLGQTALESLQRHRVTLPDATPMPAGTDVVGRGPELHAFTDTTWYQLSIDDRTLE